MYFTTLISEYSHMPLCYALQVKEHDHTSLKMSFTVRVEQCFRGLSLNTPSSNANYASPSLFAADVMVKSSFKRQPPKELESGGTPFSAHDLTSLFTCAIDMFSLYTGQI